jgi:hypothetical protein
MSVGVQNEGKKMRKRKRRKHPFNILHSVILFLPFFSSSSFHQNKKAPHLKELIKIVKKVIFSSFNR